MVNQRTKRLKKPKLTIDDIKEEVQFWLDKLIDKIDHNDMPLTLSFEGLSDDTMASFEHRGHEFFRDCLIRMDVDDLLKRILNGGGTKTEMRVVVCGAVAHELAHFHINPYLTLLGISDSQNEALHELIACLLQNMSEGILRNAIRRPKKVAPEDDGAEEVATQNIRTKRETKGSDPQPCDGES